VDKKCEYPILSLCIFILNKKYLKKFEKKKRNDWRCGSYKKTWSREDISIALEQCHSTEKKNCYLKISYHVKFRV